MSTATTTRPRRKKPGRARLIARALTPRRVARMQARWRRRRRKARAATQAVKQAPAKAAAGARRVRQAPGNAKRKVTAAARAARARRGAVRCSCGQRVPPGQMETHLANHEARAQQADKRQQATRAANARAKGRKPPRAPRKPTKSQPKVPSQRKPATPRRPVVPSRATAAQTGGWVVLSTGAFLAAPLGVAPGPWTTVAGVTFVSLAGVTYVTQTVYGVGATPAPDREAKKALKSQAKAQGCSSRCMASTKPSSTCRCPCGGTTHGSLTGRAAA